MVLALVHKRLRPMVTRAPLSMLQPLVNRLKLVFKEVCIPAKSRKIYFIITPMYTFSVALLIYTTLPFDPYLDFFINTKYSLFLTVCLFTIRHHGVLFRSMFSNNKMAVISTTQAAILSISHSLSIFLTMMGSVFICGSLNLKNIMLKQGTTNSLFLALMPLSILYMIALLSETQKVPFDVVKAEAETASEFMIEYSGISYALLALSKYIAVICSIQLFVLLFTSLKYIELAVFKFTIILFMFLFIRASLPNFRFDQAVILQ
jgi:NADH-quinone oxidoreductase subunit H